MLIYYRRNCTNLSIMTEAEYYGEYPSEENGIDVNELRKTIYNGFMLNLEIVYNVVKALPDEIQLETLISMMREI